jgi:hypothetical protein
MKRKLNILLMLIVGIMSSINALAADFGYGIKGNLGASMINNAEKFFDNPKAGFFSSKSIGYGGGVYGEYNIIDAMGVRVEALLNYAGTSYRGELKEHSYSAGYVKLPILVKYYPMGVDSGFSLLVGPELGFPLFNKNYKEKTREKDKDKDILKEKTDDVYKADKKKREDYYFSNYTFGINVGAEYEMSEIGLSFALNYIADLTNFLNTDATRAKGVIEDENAKLQNIRLSVGYNIAAALA